MERSGVVWAAAVLALGLAVGGWFVGDGFLDSRRERYVTVKGLAERDVEADLALWPFQVAAAADDLAAAQSEIERSTRAVLAFVARQGIDTTAAELQGVEVTDRVAQMLGPNARSGPRFTVQQLVMVRSEDVAGVHAASQRVGELIDDGVVLRSGSGYGPVKPTFLFKGLNALKPVMIAEAMASARESAAQFAEDSGSRLGGIRRANQGVFQILPRDAAPGMGEADQVNKTVRVVSTIDYYLRD
ncbi:MAG: SIMPL domain-containing protein [Gemmatimonadota bacterium]